MSLHHFYHIYADGSWKEPVSEHIKALKEYGLYEALTTFKIGFVGSKENTVRAINYLSEQGILFEMCDNKETGWEQVTQIPMWEYAKQVDGLFLYAHSKGAAHTHEVNTRWRRSMIWHNVCQWKFAVEKLKDHGAYGCHFIQPLLEGMPEHRQGNWMMAGTFFWIRGEILKRFPGPDLATPHSAEGWIGYGYAEEPFSVYDCTPYFPNSDEFMDGWINSTNYAPANRGKSYAPMPTINTLT